MSVSWGDPSVGTFALKHQGAAGLGGKNWLDITRPAPARSWPPVLAAGQWQLRAKPLGGSREGVTAHFRKWLEDEGHLCWTQVLERRERMALVLAASLIETCRGNGHLLAPLGCPSVQLPTPPLRREMNLEMNPEEKGDTDSEHPDCKGF